MSRGLRFVVAVAGCAALAGGLYLARTAATSRRPSLILISIDTLRADAVSGFGAPPDQTPTLLAFGDESIRFDNAISATHFTASSHATMLTGFSPYVHCATIARGKLSPIPPSIPTLAEILHRFGYATGGFTDAGQVCPEVGFNRGFDTFIAENTGLTRKSAAIDAFLARRGERPFFLFAHTYRAHAPYRPVARSIPALLAEFPHVLEETKRDSDLARALSFVCGASSFDNIVAALVETKPFTDEYKRFLRRTYDSGAIGADEEVASLLSLLKARGVYDDSVIVITSDHGEAFFEHGIAGHQDIHEECVHVPLMLRLPEGKKAGGRVSATFPSVNLVPTLLELLHVALGDAFEGRSIARDLLKDSVPEEIAFLSWRMSQDTRLPRCFGARSCAGKIIETKVKSPKDAPNVSSIRSHYFDLRDDPKELVDRSGSGDAEESRLADALRQARVKWLALRDVYAPAGTMMFALPDERERDLRAIGYVK